MIAIYFISGVVLFTLILNFKVYFYEKEKH